MTKPILIAGPTASGKSQFALALAREFDGVIINADSCQVYQELSVISARPSVADMEDIPHRLYGHISGVVPYSTGLWLDDVSRVLGEIKELGKRAIFVGGTGLYFQALLNGLSEVPEIEPSIRAYWRAEAERVGSETLHGILVDKDPLMAEVLNPGDTQRIVRALEVIESTKRSLKLWQQESSEPLLCEDNTHRFVVSFEREVLYERINRRFAEMVGQGGLDEVRAVMALKYSLSQQDRLSTDGLPMFRALGVPELMAHLEGEVTPEEAVSRAQQQTRRYAKRQLTWLRRNMISWNWLDLQYLERNKLKIFSNIHENG